jgi:multidrug resistance efflux pump
MEIKDALELAKDKLEAARQAFEPYKFKSSSDQTRRQLRDEVELARGDFNAIMRRIELEAALISANANLEKAERKYDTLLSGPDPDEVALAEAKLKDAEAQLEVVRSQLGSASLNAPIAGTAVSVDILPGETVLPGQTVFTLADLSELRVETTDLSERDVAQVAVGQDVSVYIEALDLDVPGSVRRISPGADVVGGDVVYTVLIELDEQPANLRWGMTVEVNIETD